MDTEVLRQKFQELRSNVVANTVRESAQELETLLQKVDVSVMSHLK